MPSSPAIPSQGLPTIDAEVVAPSGAPCDACGTPIEPLDKFCPACRTPNPHYHAPSPPLAGTKPGPSPSPPTRSVSEGPTEILDAHLVEPSPLSKHFQCQTCGAEVVTDPSQHSYVCPFCDSTYVQELAPNQTGRQPPEFVIGFSVTPDQAQDAFKKWLREKTWFRPSDLATASALDKLKGIYLPFWAFTMLAESQWQAQIGEYWYRTETYTERDSKGNLVTRTRQVRETEWWPLAGRHHRYYSGYLVSGSRGLAQDQSLRIQPFNLPALKRYEPYFLAGWLAEEYSIAKDEALVLCQQEFQRQEQRNIASFLPGDTHSGLAAESRFSHINSDLCLLPIYILSYRYQDKLYRFLLNGQTGKFSGDKPVSSTRIAIAVAIGVTLLLILVLIIVILANLN